VNNKTHKGIAAFLPVPVLIFLSSFATGQNLCPNHSFEYLLICPTFTGQINYASSWDNAPGSLSTSDLFNSCHIVSLPPACQDVGIPFNFAGHATAHSGNSYAGIVAYNSGLVREYIQATLDSSLQPGTAYRVEGYIRKSAECRYAVDKIGILISSGAVYQPGSDYINAIPQVESLAMLNDTAQWILLTGIYIASGGEDHITIGNFRNNASTTIADNGNNGNGCTLNTENAYYYIDDIKVERIYENISISGDSIICTGNSTLLTSGSNVSTWWSVAGMPYDTIGTGPNLQVSPLITTTYVLNGITARDSFTVYVVDPPVVSIGSDTTICEGAGVSLDAGDVTATYSWSTGETTRGIVITLEGTYEVIVDNGGCTASDGMHLSVLPNPKINLDSELEVCSREAPVELDAGPAVSYLWFPTGDTTRIVVAESQKTYTITVIRENGCMASAEIIIVESCPAMVFIPGAFTPNNDGINEIFIPSLSNIKSYEMKIFNCWGSMLFETVDTVKGWDGTFRQSFVPEGMYAYYISYQPENGPQEKIYLKGFLQLIR